jgi:hypothetical protein
LIIIGATVALYASTLDDYFQTDDFIFLRAARFADLQTYVEDSFDFTKYDKHDQMIEFLRDNDVALPFLSYRPLYFVSLKLMNMAFGDAVLGYHLVSLGVHIANIVLVWLIAKRLLRGSIAPLAAAAIFALHPAYVASVAWISDIGTPSSVLFALLALLLFMKSIDTTRTNVALYCASIASALTAVLFHQQAIPWAGVIVVYGFVHELLRGESWPLPRAVDLAIPFVALIVGAIVLHGYITANTPVQEESLGIGTHMLAQLKDLGAGSVYPVATSNDAAQLVSLAGLLVLLAGTPLLWRSGRRSLLIALFCIVWLFAALLPLLTLDKVFEASVFFRKLYVVGPSLSILLALGGQGLVRLVPIDGHPLRVAAVSVLALFMVSGILFWNVERRDNVSDAADEWERYASELLNRYPALPEGTTLNIVNPPPRTRIFDDVYIVASAQALYGRVDARVLRASEVNSVEASPLNRVFRYSERE